MRDLAFCTKQILRNIDGKGLARHDPNELDAFLIKHTGSFSNGRFRQALRLAELCAPRAFHALVGKKSIKPTTYYHLGMAYLNGERLGLLEGRRSIQMADQAISAYYQPDTGCWLDFDAVVTQVGVSTPSGDRTLTMPLHCVARINILLLELWRRYGRMEYAEIAMRSAEIVAQRHHVTDYGDGRLAISYFSVTEDNTLNVNSEYLEWISMLPSRSAELTALGQGILQMLLTEQNEDGSFYYLGKDYMQQIGRTDPGIDHHHTAYTLKNLLGVYHSDLLEDESTQKALWQCCLQGVEYLLSRLYHEDTGVAQYMSSSGRRGAEPTQYSESITMLCAYLREPALPASLRQRIQTLLPKAMTHLTDTIRPDGSVPCEQIYGKWINLDSIRWGNGPALQAIYDYMDAEREGLLRNESEQ